MEKINTEVFLAAAELGSFKKTADRLGYTQAGISYIISSMEESLGLRLFDREYGGLKLTSEGRELLPVIRQLAGSERLLSEKVRDLKNLDAGEIRVLVFYSIAIRWMPEIIARFHRDYPNIRIHQITCDNGEQAEMLTWTGNVDCGFFVFPITRKLDVIPLMHEPMMASFAPDHPAAVLDVFPVRDLGKYPYISLSYDDESNAIFRKYGIHPQIAYSCENDLGALAMAEQNLGYCINPKILLEGSPYRLKSMEFDEPVHRTIGMGARSMEMCPKAARVFMQYARDWVEEQYGPYHAERPQE